MTYEEGDYTVKVDKIVALRSLSKRIYDFHFTVYYQEERQDNEIATGMEGSESEAIQKAADNIKYHKMCLAALKEAANG